MFCPKCGGAVKDGAGFCPKCGAKVQGGGSAGPDRPKSPWKAGWKTICLAGCGAAAVLLAALLLLVPLKAGGGSEIRGKELMDAYFESHTGYGASNQDLYQDCFRYAVHDMSLQLSNKMAFLLESAGVDTGNVDLEQASSWVGDKILVYFSHSDNQIRLVDEVLSHSSCKVGDIQKEGGRAYAKVTVNSLDISDVNRILIDDSVSIPKFASLAVQFVLEGELQWLGGLADLASGDLSFILDGFVEKAGEAKGRKTYIGQVEFVYDQESGEWGVGNVDEGLLEAYYGMIR